MSDYIKRENAIKLKDICTDTYADKKYFIEQLKAIQSADVVEVSEILKTADEQEKQGFIQTAKLLRELVK